MQIAVIGAGWVGITTACVLAEQGHDVLLSDISTNRIKTLDKGEVPFFEPGLQDLLKQVLASGKLKTSTSNADSLKAEVVFVCVNTPTLETGKTDLTALQVVAKDFAKQHITDSIFVIKSTVPVGTCSEVERLISEQAQISGHQAPFTVAHTPEFLAEGTALRDSRQPARIIIGAGDAKTLSRLESLLKPQTESPILLTDLKSAELIKCASNSFLATKISFMNEIANYANTVGADPMEVAKGMGLDPRIGKVRPGVGFGGGCFPKDVKALLGQGHTAEIDFKVLQAAHDVNEKQRQLVYERMSTALGGVQGRKIAIWGLAFKPNTDDIREAPAMYFVRRLLAEGAKAVVFDPKVKHFDDSNLASVEFAQTALEAVKGAEALAVMCEWPEFAQVSLIDLSQAMSGQVLVDGRYVWNRIQAEGLGFKYIV